MKSSLESFLTFTGSPLYNISIWINGGLVFDDISVRVKDVEYMYDKSFRTVFLKMKELVISC